MSANESRPAGAASELMAASKTSISQPTDTAQEARPTSDSSLRFEDRHAAWLAGVEHGRAERDDIEIEDQIQARIHDRVRASLGLARLSARHGEAFSQLVKESGERDE